MLTTVLRGLVAASFAVLPLTVPSPAHAAETLPLAEAVTRLPVGTESRDGYDRDAFRRWNAGTDPSDGCNTRAEVLLSEAVEPPVVGPGCRLTGGRWWSYYDQMALSMSDSSTCARVWESFVDLDASVCSRVWEALGLQCQCQPIASRS
ncbi:hypothetical protein SUDANB176_07632 (plasmid) [Streptomyces sp. enrichment culture]